MNDTITFIGEVPWHGLGVQVPSNISAKDMIKVAGLDWHVHKRPAVPSSHRDHCRRFLLKRDPVTGESEEVTLGFVSDRYEPLQNEQAFAFFEPFIESKWATFHTAGALGNGERVWVLVKLRDAITVVPNDTIDKFLLLSNSHDGKGAVSVRFTPIRVVCQNTLNLAVEGGKGLKKGRHSLRLPERLREIQVNTLIELVEATFEAAGKLFRGMAEVEIDDKSRDAYLQTVFPRTAEQAKEGIKPNRWKRIEYILDDRTVTPPQTKTRMWALYNAVTRAEDYRATREAAPERRLERVWFGTGSDLKISALEAARNLLESRRNRSAAPSIGDHCRHASETHGREAVP